MVILGLDRERIHFGGFRFFFVNAQLCFKMYQWTTRCILLHHMLQ